jgi:hypothetical protein
VFNVGDRAPIDIRVEWRALGLPARCVLRDLWERNDIGVIDGGYTFRVAPHASGLYRLAGQTQVPKAVGPVLPGRLPLTFPSSW